MTALDDKLAALAAMSLAQLRGEWLQLHREPPPATLGRLLLTLGIAYRLQERAYGSLPPTAARELDHLARQRERTGNLGAEPTAMLKLGTRLVREWGGVTHQVELVEDGYRYRDQRYGSLSQIAQKITGAKWSGPRFFGLTPRTAGGRARHG